MTPETAIVDTLAVCRLVRLVTKDTLLDTPRDLIEARLEKAGHTKLVELVRCPWCCSPYVAFGVMGLRRYMPRLWHPIAKALAASHLAGLAANVDTD